MIHIGKNEIDEYHNDISLFRKCIVDVIFNDDIKNFYKASGYHYDKNTFKNLSCNFVEKFRNAYFRAQI